MDEVGHKETVTYLKDLYDPEDYSDPQACFDDGSYSSIQWNSDCNFVLTYEKILNAKAEGFIGKTIDVEITEVRQNGYTSISKSDLLAEDLKLEVVQIK